MESYTIDGFHFRTDGRVMVCRRRWSDQRHRDIAVTLPLAFLTYVGIAAALGWPTGLVRAVVVVIGLTLAVVGFELRQELATIVLDRESDTLSRGGRAVCPLSRIVGVRVAERTVRGTGPIDRRVPRVALVRDDAAELLLHESSWSARPPDALARELARFLGVPCESVTGPRRD